MILEQTILKLLSNYTSKINNLTIDELRIGIHLTAVKLSDGSYGVASTVIGDEPFCLKKDRDFGIFTPTNIKGKSVVDLLTSPKSTSAIDTMKMAVINAISSSIIDYGTYKVLDNTDPIDLINFETKKNVTIVGAFQSYIKKVSNTNANLKVLELDENALIESQKHYFVPAENFKTLIPASDVVIITGLTLVNNTIDGLLNVIPSKCEVIITGPSSGLIPDVLFENKVNYIGATKLTNTDILFDVVSEGGKGYHLFKYCAKKYTILNE